MTYMYPFPRGTYKTQPFGANKSQGANGPGGHTGDDYAVNVGTPVRAAADGVIELSSWVSENYQENPWWLTQMGGDNLVLNCGSTKPTFIYAHLSESTANVGDRVVKGQIIGYSGNTGTATTGPHCHVEVLPPGYVLNSATYGRVDPEIFFDEYYIPGTIQAQGTTAIKESDDMPLTLAQQPGNVDVWVGNGVTRRKIPNDQTLKDYIHLHNTGEQPLANDGKIRQTQNLDVFGQPV